MTKIAKTAPDPIDIHVGKMIRARRLAIGVSQMALAQALGITFQQIQKYEKGANRISASKLFEAARTLDTPVGAFFEGLDDSHEGQSLLAAFAEFLGLDGAAALAGAFVALTPVQRRRLVDLAEVMAPDAARV